ncbi:hypothetical protein ACFX13_032442 [Malus domestica]
MMSSVFVFLLTISFLTTLSSSATTSFIFSGCSQQRYLPAPPAPRTPYGLFQCRGDLSNIDWSQCVARSVSQLGTLCLDSCSGALQCLDSCKGCFEKYDNATFLGVEDKIVVVKKYESSTGFDSYSLTSEGTYTPSESAVGAMCRGFEYERMLGLSVRSRRTAQKLAINVTSGSTTVMAPKNNGEIAFLESAKQKSNEEDKRGNHMGTLIHAGIRQDLVKEMYMGIPSLVCMSPGNPCIGKRGSSM